MADHVNISTAKCPFTPRRENTDSFHSYDQNIDCGYSLEPPRRGGSNEYPQSMFLIEAVSTYRRKKKLQYAC